MQEKHHLLNTPCPLVLPDQESANTLCQVSARKIDSPILVYCFSPLPFYFFSPCSLRGHWQLLHGRRQPAVQLHGGEHHEVVGDQGHATCLRVKADVG